MKNRKLKVCISFDVEFNINRTFVHHDSKPLSHEMFDVFDGERKIGFNDILNTLKANNTHATFFVEALNSHYFSKDEMGKYAKKLVSYGHDVQLHTHPCWQFFNQENWKKKVPASPEDNYCNSTCEDIVSSLEYALDVFNSWGIEKPRAFRAGNLAATSNLYNALESCGFKYSSNIGLPYFLPTEEELRLENQTKLISNVLEQPVTSFSSMGYRQKVLTITGTSFYEIKQVLAQCYKQGFDNVIVLTHIHEFIKYDSKKINKINLSRLNRLCKLINQEENYESVFLNGLSLKERKPKGAIQTSFTAGLITIAENVINDKLL